jgi:serine/threonine-protein kinase RsbW
MSITRSVVVSSTPSAVVDVFNQIQPALQANNFSEEDIFAVHLSLEEAFINAVKHGNKMEPRKAVKVDYSIEPDKVEICMTDEGEGFDPEVIPDPRYGDNLYKPAGRGMLLMRSFMDVLEYNQKGNSLRMIRYREKRTPKTTGKSR